MNKEEFLNKYPGISLDLLKKYVDAYKNKDMDEIIILSLGMSFYSNDDNIIMELSEDLEELLNYYNIEYNYSEKWEEGSKNG